MMTSSKKQTYSIDSSHTAVEFVVRHMMIAKVRGRFTAVVGTIVVPDGSNVPEAVEATIETASIDTHEDQRDQHLRSGDFLDAEKFGQLNFRSTGFEGSGDAFSMRGDLTIRGVTREVVFHVTFEGRVTDPWGNSRIGYEAHATISRKDFGVTWNQALETGGVLIGDDIRIEITAEAVAQG
ncbi:MAG TPA: YceI family protein [Candidatus Acidoferrales bacterium]|nr:YceI family protein [Candidatus Acidoferrales bacterium]